MLGHAQLVHGLDYATPTWHARAGSGGLVHFQVPTDPWYIFKCPWVVHFGCPPRIPLDPHGQRLEEIRCVMTVRQRLFWVSCVLETDKARSQSFAGNAYLDDDTNEARLVYVYRGWPRLADQKTNPSHQGTTLLALNSDGALVGTYFTDRCTRGELRLSRVGT